MLSKDRYNQLKHEQTRLTAEVRQIASESVTERKNISDQTKSAIDEVIQYVKDPAMLQNKLNEIIDHHTHHIAQSTAHFQRYKTRIDSELFSVFQEIDRHVNHSFVLGFTHLRGQDDPHGHDIHWHIYFRYPKFNEHSRVFFLKPPEINWKYEDETEGALDDLIECNLVVGYRSFTWLDGYNAENDTLVVKFLN